MTILKEPASRENHTNVLMHIQGCFHERLDSRQHGKLHDIILNYNGGLLPILAPLTLLKHYLAEYPDSYLLTQNYFDPYPNDLALQLMIKQSKGDSTVSDFLIDTGLRFTKQIFLGEITAQRLKAFQLLLRSNTLSDSFHIKGFRHVDDQFDDIKRIFLYGY